jgi:hypothetical protein
MMQGMAAATVVLLAVPAIVAGVTLVWVLRKRRG